MADAPPRADLDKELRRVDESFAMLKPGRDLDDRLAGLLDGTTAPPPPRRPRAIAAACAVVGALAVAALVVSLARPAQNLAAVDTRSHAPTSPTTPTSPTSPASPVEEPQRPAAARVDRAASAPVPNALPPVRGERIAAVDEDVRFVDVPLGTLEVRAPAIVDVDEHGAVVVNGSVRVLAKGREPRTLLAGQSIAWNMPPPPAPPSPRKGADDDAVQATLERARALQERGAYAEAADALADLLAEKPAPRVVDTVSFERAALLAKARDVADACAALAEHARRFPHSENAAAVQAAQARLSCK